MNSPTNISSIDYRRSISKIITALEYLQNLSQKLNLTNLLKIISYTLNRIETNAFKIVVLGDFNRGKSTFINALIGQEILPSDILATTATLSRISYSLTPGAKITFKDGSQEEIDILQLSNYVTKLTLDSEATAAKIKETIIYYPAKCCQNNVEIIDTPGLSDDSEMTAVTTSILHQCDLAIMVISAQSPFGISEGDFLTNELLANGINHVLFVVNRIDCFSSAEDAKKVIKLIKQRIKNCIEDWVEQPLKSQTDIRRIGTFKVFGVSAFEALQAKQSNNIPLLAKSLFVNFEYSLKKLITQDRGLIQLEVSNNKIINCSQEIIRVLLEQESTLKEEQLKLNISSQKVKDKIALLILQQTETLKLINRTLESLREQIFTSNARLENSLKQMAQSVIESTTLDIAEEINIANRVLNAMQTVTQTFVNNIQAETQQSLNLALLQTHDFIDLFKNNILQISEEISYSGLDETILIKVMENICNRINKFVDIFNRKQPISLSFSFPSNSEIFIFTKQANGSGTVTGAAIGFALLGPLGGAIGGSIGGAVGNSIRNSNFKESYLPQVMLVIYQEVKNMNVNQSVNNYIYQACEELQEIQILFMNTIKPILDNTENNLIEKYAKLETKIITKQQVISHDREKIEQILADAQKLSEQLSLISL